MQAQSKRILQDGKQYDQYFPKPDFRDTVLIPKRARLEDTMGLIKKVLINDQSDTARIARLLKGKNLRETAQNIWNFVYNHIQYVRDQEGIEEVRRPARLWAGRTTGGDCDCMSVFIGTILGNLKIPYSLRIAEYDSGYYQHIYPIIISDPKFYSDRENRKHYIVVDCVKDEFDKEHPYKRIKDFDIQTMDLAYLSGLGDTNTDRFEGLNATQDSLDLLQGLGLAAAYYVDGLGKIRRSKQNGVPIPPVPVISPTSNSTASATTTPASSPQAQPEKFKVRRTHIYKLANGTTVKLGRYVRNPGERFVLFKAPGQTDFTQNGVVSETTFFIDNNDVCWGIATINNTYWKKASNANWQASNPAEYNQAKPNAKPPIPLTGYILKDGTKIFLDKRMPREVAGYPVKWKSTDEEGGWQANGLLTSLFVSETMDFVLGRNGQGSYYKSTGFARWQSIEEDEYMELRQKALKGFNDVDAQFSMNGDGDLTLNAPSENKGLYIPYEVLEKLFKSRLDVQNRSYEGIQGIGYLLGDDVLNAIEPVMEGLGDSLFMNGLGDSLFLNGTESEVIGSFGNTEILGTVGYYDNVGSLVELGPQLLGENALLVVDGLGRVRQKRAKRGGDPAASADSRSRSKGGPQKLGLYIPTHTLNLLLKWRSDNVSRMQSKGIQIFRGDLPDTVSGLGNFFDIIKAPLKAVLSIAKFIPIPAIKIAANLIDKVIPDGSSNNNVQSVERATQDPVQALQSENASLKQQLATHLQTANQAHSETSSGYDQSVKGLGNVATDVFSWVTTNPIKTGAIVLGSSLLAYELFKKNNKPHPIRSFLGLSGNPKKRKRHRKKLKVIRL
jgi:hypothetical protein